MSRIFIFIILLILVEFYAFWAIKRVFKSKRIVAAYLLASVLIIVYFGYSIFGFSTDAGQTQHSLMVLSYLLLYSLTKVTITTLLLVEDVVRLLQILYNFFFRKNHPKMIPSRRKFVSQLALGIAAIPFFSILYGIFEGKYNFKVIRKAVFFDDLPDNFEGLKVLQLSDIHCGSFDNRDKIEYAVDLINQQEFDVLVFTGDLVNNFGHEMEPWIDTFKKIKTPKYGKYSVLGNHDYGEYTIWKNEVEKQQNFDEIKSMHEKIGFELLLNQSIYLENKSDKIAIVGVENWGHRFYKKGDLNKASANLTHEDFKILLSHDPSHFDLEVKNHPKNFQLTLSGHTHGLQFGVEVPNIFKWSPIQYIYKHWAGLYRDAGKFLYVNRGFGFHAYSGRVGIWPEITVLELKKALKS